MPPTRKKPPPSSAAFREDTLRDGIGHAGPAHTSSGAPRGGGTRPHGVGRGGAARFLAFEGDEIHQVMHMHRIAAGKHPRQAGLHRLIDERPVRARVQRDSGSPGQFVFGDQSHRQQKRVAVDTIPGNRPAFFIHRRHHHLFHPPAAPDFGDGMREVKQMRNHPQALVRVALSP